MKKGGMHVPAGAALAAFNDTNRLSWTVAQYAGYLENARENKKGMLPIQVFKRVRNVEIKDNALLDFNITAEELMLLDKTSDDQLIQEIAKKGAKNLLELCFAKRMITDTDHCSDYIINAGTKDQDIIGWLYNVLAWFGCNEILKELFKVKEYGSSKYSFNDYGGISVSTSGGTDNSIRHSGQKNYYTPIMLAAKAGYLDVIKTLCENGASAKFISRTDSNNDTAKHHAARVGRKDIMDYLEEKGDKGQEKNAQNKTPNELYDDFLKQEAARKTVEFNRNLAKVAVCALAVISIAAICYNRAAIANMLGFGKSGLSVS